MNRWAGLAAGLMLAAGAVTPVMAQEPPEGFVWYVLREQNDAGFDIDDPTNRPPLVTEVPAGVLEAVDADGDDRTDWLIRWAETMQVCGTGGCRVTLYIGTEDGFVRAFDRQALQFDIRTAEGERRVVAELHPLACDDGRETCVRSWAWDEAAQRLMPVISRAGLPLPPHVAPVAWPEGAGE